MARAANEIESVPAGVFETSHSSNTEESGRFLIEGRSASTMLPPTGSDADLLGTPLAADDLGEPVIELVRRRPRSLPPPVPVASISQRVLAPAPVEDADSALEPYYRGLPISDRFELRIDDLSLDLDNPYARSSLVPPPPKPFPTMRWAGIVVGALAAAGFVVAMQARPHSTQVAPVAGHVAVKPAVVEPKPEPVVIAAAPVAVIAPLSVEVAPVESAPPVVAPVVAAAPVAKITAVAVTTPKPIAKVEVTPVAKTEETVAPEAAAVAPTQAPTELAATETPASIFAETEEVEVAEADLPESLSREAVVAGFDKIRPELDTCVAGGHGTSVANVTISGTGHVSYAMIEGAFVGTPEGSCIARTLRKAAFPRFSSPTLKVSYPFVF